MLPRYGPVTTPNAMSNLHDITLNPNEVILERDYYYLLQLLP